MGEMRNVYIILTGKQKGGDHMEDLGIDRRILECTCILEKYDGKCSSRIRTSGGFSKRWGI
jgi:hypothetical protein